MVEINRGGVADGRGRFFEQLLWSDQTRPDRTGTPTAHRKLRSATASPKITDSGDRCRAATNDVGSRILWKVRQAHLTAPQHRGEMSMLLADQLVSITLAQFRYRRRVTGLLPSPAAPRYKSYSQVTTNPVAWLRR